MPSSVLVGCFQRTVWVKVEGRGTFQTSSGLKEFVKQMIQRGYRDFVVDLCDCELMDSTFMGTLAGVALRLRELGQGSLRAVNVNARNTDLLSNLGLDQLFEVAPSVDGQPPVGPSSSDLVRAAPQKGLAKDQKEIVLEAHEALVEADSSNEARFKDVLEYLRQDLGSEANED